MALTGARISEVLQLTEGRIDDGNNTIVFETLKRRERGIFRAVPVPRGLIRTLNALCELQASSRNEERSDGRIWNWSRTTAWKRVKFVAESAGIPEPLAKPKALRHAFGVKAVQDKIALSLIKKWLGHTKIETTAIYAEPIGDEERALAELMWANLPKALHH